MSDHELAEMLITVIRKFEKRKIYTSFTDNSGDLADKQVNSIQDSEFYYLFMILIENMHDMLI